jgi:hypothetical protein
MPSINRGDSCCLTLARRSRLMFQLIEDFVDSTAQAFPGLRQTAVNASHSVPIIGYVLMRCSIGFGFCLDAQNSWPARLVYAFHQSRLNVAMD